MSRKPLTEQQDASCLNPTTLDPSAIASDMYRLTCRVHFDAPGFCLLNAGRDIGSVPFRRLMVAIKQEMATIHEAGTGNTLAYLSATRFDQQESTRAHLDAGPEECFLMLGYEPSTVESDLLIVDYAKCAHERGLTPKEFLAKHNPMFESEQDTLKSYSTRIPCFSPTDYQIICINNSSAAYSEEAPQWQGTLHQANILTPNDAQRRIINSTMIASVPAGTPDALDSEALREFVSTLSVRRRGYDKPHLEDDT